MKADHSYAELITRSGEAATLASCSALLGWDEQTYMPHAGAEHRGRQMAALAGLHHEKATHPRIGELLGELEGSDLTADPESVSAVNVRELRRNFDRLTRLPRRLVEELARVTSIGQQEWVEARRLKDFGVLRPTLETIFALKRDEAACLRIGDDPYDSLLDEYEPGARGDALARLFGALRDGLVPIVAEILGAGRPSSSTVLNRDYPVDRQRIFGEAIAVAVGFDFRRGRLDTTAHPFCTMIGPGDCRITTRFDPRDLGDGVFGILHEVGHGLYDQGLDPAHFGTPMGEAVSLGVHESQSRLWENLVGRGRAFWSYAFPMARQVFHDVLHDVDADEFHRAVNLVEPSLVRVRADEVTYNLHVIIRFELERALLAGDLDVSELCGAWDDAYASVLGLRPPDDALGCLQDIHWSAGLVGYFPTYTLGNLYAAQLFDRFVADEGDPSGAFARGDFDPLLAWLRDRVHRHGRRYPPAQLIERATGSPLDHRPFLAALARKYGPLYGVRLAPAP
ncbi:MAG TPA: carboxypeptidase M32 [Isosphaeraceae bacterium]|jgi:carboxypeptidase Taq|nr:carboxypeptidase M32 [Isosphaeraceae bacterium]